MPHPHPPLPPHGGKDDHKEEHRDHKDIKVEPIDKEIKARVKRIPATAGIAGGFALTGWIDVEKKIRIRKRGPVYFLEQKLPFQVLVICFDP